MKTPQEAAREYANDNGFMLDEWHDIHNAFLAGDAFGYRRGMGKAYRWISVEDELPEVGKNGISATVLVRAGNYHCASYCKNKHYPHGAWFDPAMNLSIDVTHWRPIEPVNK